MAYSSPATVVTATTITSTWGNSVKTAADYLANPPACRAYNNAAIAVTTATIFALTLNAERYKTIAGMHSTSSNTHRIVATDAGLYVVQGHIQFASNATGFRGLFIFLNSVLTGSTVTAGTRIASEFRGATNGDFTEISISTMYKLAANDHLTLACYQTSGGNLNANSASAYSPEFAATWIGLG